MSEMTIGCALWTLGATPDVASLARQMEIAAEIGCTSVQPWIVDFEYRPCILDPEVGSAADRREVARIAKSLGLSLQWLLRAAARRRDLRRVGRARRLALAD